MACAWKNTHYFILFWEIKQYYLILGIWRDSFCMIFLSEFILTYLRKHTLVLYPILGSKLILLYFRNVKTYFLTYLGKWVDSTLSWKIFTHMLYYIVGTRVILPYPGNTMIWILLYLGKNMIFTLCWESCFCLFGNTWFLPCLMIKFKYSTPS